MKIALAGMSHESNTFNKQMTGLETFSLINGDEFVHLRYGQGAARGIYETLTKAQAEAVPLFFARSIPSGTVRHDAYVYIKSRIIDSLSKTEPFDGIMLALHGSMAVDGIYDPEGDLLESIRHVVGHKIPVVVSLDMHATVTERMVMLSDGFSVFRTAPHVDAEETGIEAAKIILSILKEGKKTVNAFVKIPILVSGEQSETRVDPAKTLFESLDEYDKKDGVLRASFVLGFPWADSPFGGAGALVTGWADKNELLKEHAKKMAKAFWDKRAEFTYSTPAMPPKEAIKTAIMNPAFPVIISDSADNPTAGASQDTTRFLRLMIEMDVKNALYTCVADPAAYKTCTTKSINEEFRLEIGAYYSKKEDERCFLDVELVDLKKSGDVLYAILKSGDVMFTVSNKRCATYSPETLRELGLEPESFNIIGIKAGYLSPEYQAMSKKSILALTDGDTALDLRKLPYIKTPRPIYPLDLNMQMG